MKCPLRFELSGEGSREEERTLLGKATERVTECIRDECAWWVEEAGACAITLLATRAAHETAPT